MGMFAMEIMKIVGLGITATVLSIILKQKKPEFAVQLSLVVGIIIFFIIMPQLEYVIKTLNSLSERVNLKFVYFSSILKIIGVAYIAEFGAQIARDANENAIASKIELGAKIIIMTFALPILTALLDLIVKIIP